MTLHKKICLLLVLFLMMACNLPRAVVGLATQPDPDNALVGTIVAQTLTAYPSNGPLSLSTSTPVLLETPPAASATALPGRPEYQPGELVDYVAQSGDTLPALAAHFNTTVLGIRVANPQIPADATTLQPGSSMKIPIIYSPAWGTRTQIMPDSLFVNGPSADGFDAGAFISSRPGWLKDYRETIGDADRSGIELVNTVATNFSISPRLLLALLEYQAGGLSQPVEPSIDYPLSIIAGSAEGLYLQLVWAANFLNVGYYEWRTGGLTQIVTLGGTVERPDPWQNAATVGLQYYFSRVTMTVPARSAWPEGLKQTYAALFGDPWTANADMPLIPANLSQPALILPIPRGYTWSFSGGPHAGWGTAAFQPWAGLDFAPLVSNCVISPVPAVAMADGVVARSEAGVVMLDLDGDGNERTGWDILYLHIAGEGEARLGQKLKLGDPVGFPSCEGGNTTGTHVHIARKYNGEWIPADGVIPFNMEGWVVHAGVTYYKGTLTRGNQLITASGVGEAGSMIKAGQ